MNYKRRMESVKKAWDAPRVLQEMEVLLERDLLQGPSSLGSVEATGQEIDKRDEYIDKTWD